MAVKHARGSGAFGMRPQGMPLGGKEIPKFKVAVSSDCILRCRYCLIDKNAGETITLDCAQKAIYGFLASPGNKKKLEVYGGEPLLKFELVRKICKSALDMAGKAGKVLGISLATNGVLLEERHLEFLKQNNIHLSISISGSKESHDSYRVFPNGKGSFDSVAGNLPKAFDILGKRAVDALFVVHPQKAGRMFEDFKSLVSLGFENINVECVHGVRWSKRSIEDFVSNIRRVKRYIFERINAGGYVLIETFLAALDRESSARDVCPFDCDLEVYPNGEYSFYPFAFVDGLKSRPKVAVGNVRDGLIPRYRDCSFDASSPECKNCTRQYYRLPGISEGNIPYIIRTRMFRDMMNSIILKSRENPRFKDYVRETALRSRMGYR